MSPTDPDVVCPKSRTRQQRAGQAVRLEDLLRRAQVADGRQRAELLDAAILAGVPLAQTLARRYHGRGVDNEDVDQVALEYLIRAVRNYRPTEDSDFRSYAVPTIRGGIRHHFRDHAWAVKLPRRLQEIQTAIHDAEGGLAAQLHRWPTLRELADELGLEVTEIIEAEQARGCFQPSSLDAPLPNDTSLSLGQLVQDPGDTYELVNQVTSLLPVVNDLADRDRLIFERRFVDHRTQAEIGAEVGLSQMQISRLLSNIVHQLRRALSA
jgi:RNA polymerase sigma-B factor